MDQGHYNCRDYRDYYVTPSFSATTIISERNPLFRHESFDELEERSRSPASLKPKFPLLKLPLELRQQILSYLLPHTQEFKDSGRLSEHARNFSAVKKRVAKGMFMPSSSGNNSAAGSLSNVVWQRGNINVLRVCKQLHEECADLIYGTNTFLLFVTCAGIVWRFRWLLPSGLAPSRSLSFIKLLPRYRSLIKRAVVHVDHVDSYTGMIKFGMAGDGLTHALKRQVQILVLALRETSQEQGEDGSEERRMAKLHIILKSETCQQEGSGKHSPAQSSKIKIQAKSECSKHEDEHGIYADKDLHTDSTTKARKRATKSSHDLEKIAEPFFYLRGVREVTVGGAVTDQFSANLAESLKSTEACDMEKLLDEGMSVSTSAGGVQLCVYGNDL